MDNQLISPICKLIKYFASKIYRDSQYVILKVLFKWKIIFTGNLRLDTYQVYYVSTITITGTGIQARFDLWTQRTFYTGGLL